jgi:hypothetical protein
MAKLSELRVSTKHIQIDKANQLVLIAAVVTTLVVVFSIVAANTLVKQMSYQNKVLGLRKDANKQLTANIKSVTALKTSYDSFENSSESVIGTADKNSKIVLDALPSKYDFPALATSLEGLIASSGNTIVNITGKDNEAKAEQDSANPKPIEIPFDVTTRGNFASSLRLISDMERSIRPFKIISIELSGSDASLETRISAVTYYQPEKKLEVEQKVVPGPKL